MRRHTFIAGNKVVGETGFEPAASWSQTMRATNLRHSPTHTLLYGFSAEGQTEERTRQAGGSPKQQEQLKHLDTLAHRP